MSIDELAGYKLVPVYESELRGGMRTAATLSCKLTGIPISGSGGPGNMIAPETYNLLFNTIELKQLVRGEILNNRQKYIDK